MEMEEAGFKGETDDDCIRVVVRQERALVFLRKLRISPLSLWERVRVRE
jgi:hypothetical protein